MSEGVDFERLAFCYLERVKIAAERNFEIYV